MADTPDLIARLESAPEGSRELSDAVLLAWGWRKSLMSTADGTDPVCFSNPPSQPKPTPRRHAPDPTRSLDDALRLVPEGWSPEQITWGKDGKSCVASIGNHGDGDTYRAGDSGVCHTPALALCAAILRANGG